MDACESDQAYQEYSAGKPRPSLGLAEKNNAVITVGRPRTRDVGSRCKLPSPPTQTAPRRCVSPNFSTTSTGSSLLVQKGAQSAERRRPSTPPSPSLPSTHTHDSVDVQISFRKGITGRLGESLWPSTMRSLNASFQSDSISIPVTKKEKPAGATSDRTPQPSSNLAHKQVELLVAGKLISERNRSPLKGSLISLKIQSPLMLSTPV